MPPHRRLLRAAALVAAALTLPAAPAAAATVDVAQNALRVTAAPGEANTIAVALSGGVLTVTDSTAAAKLAPGLGCTLPSTGRVTCPLTGVTRVELRGGDGADKLTVTANLPALLDGGEGDDVLTGGPNNDALDGGPGADVLNGGLGKDVADYGLRSGAVAVDLDLTGAVQGEAGEGDRIGVDVESATGGAGDDRLRGDDLPNALVGGAGDDVLDGRDGGDRLEGGDGADTADYGERRGNVTVDLDGNADDGASGERDDVRPDVERVQGGAGNDRLVGGPLADALLGGPGSDTLDGAGGDDLLTGEEGNDKHYGGDGHDRAEGGPGDDELKGGGGDDELLGGDGGDRLFGDDDQDLLDGGLGNDQHWGGGGEDRVIGADGDDKAYGEDGNDQLDLGAGNDGADGGAGDDALAGGDGNDTMKGGSGLDVVSGDGGDDALDGDDHDDVLEGGPGRDRLDGDGGVDQLRGGDEDDVLRGHAGNDVLDGGAGNDQLEAGDHEDALLGGEGNDRLSGGNGLDVLDGEGGDDELDGGEDRDEVRGGDGNDVVRGGGEPDRLLGGTGDDRLHGGGGEDVLDGGAGADAIEGDDGEDTVDYGARLVGVRVSNDGKADDGEPGEGDDVRPSVDRVIGGAGDDRLTGSGWKNVLDGGAGDDRLDGAGGEDVLRGGAGKDMLLGGGGSDVLEGGDGADHLSDADGTSDAFRCGAGKDTAVLDKADRPERCETRKVRGPGAGSSKGGGPQNSLPAPASKPSKRTGVKIVRTKGRFVAIPGMPGERIDRRLLADVLYLRAKYQVHVTDGYALTGHSRAGEHPVGAAVDLVPGPGGSWTKVDQLARWAEPRQNRPRPPFRWVGYDGDAGHGRGHHLHLSWRTSGKRPGRPAAWVMRMSFKKRSTSTARRVRASRYTRLGRTHNGRLGGYPSVRTGLASAPRCQGATAQLRATWKAAGRAFGIRPSILAGITEIESRHGCLMGPSSAGALGWTQFMPATWKRWGMDANGDGKASPYNSVDAIFSSARYLRASGAPGNYRKALFAYNHATWYVNDVLRRAKRYR